MKSANATAAAHANVLVVDDDRGLAQFVVEVLTDAKHEAVAVHDAAPSKADTMLGTPVPAPSSSTRLPRTRAGSAATNAAKHTPPSHVWSACPSG